MDTNAIKTVLRVMNLTASYGMVYVASPMTVGELAKHTYEIESEIRLYLVPDNSSLLSCDGIITA